ncbi:LacI family DNA-binding transcriptional regulator [Paeniglutamicibacter cryotolerans]|uniref:LacI family transcriptional regulator n=1 Tax=Paeniglutamicibacter cryotolerans TaxID=670079 RepID=A0A839QTU5_9MICC|nr:LacI family DNA-binding transcriptional regulator [Paeniglutamicibacter cryotolerans]MBB2995451.1 LacI family transcriptional regulator [Paeniglutamicibacter cryotolerans]
MAHRFSIREISRQAGVSSATVDRVIHARPGVRPGTIGQVKQAIADLEAQSTQLELSGRRFMIDVVVDAPARFHMAARRALEAELPLLRPAVFRARFHMRERWGKGSLVRELDDVSRRGSHGVLLKAPDTPEVAAAVQRLTQAGIPVITFVTDLPRSPRLAYVGMDNRAAGATAAYLMHSWLAGRQGSVAVTLSNGVFRGEEEREAGFRSTMRSLGARRAVHELPPSDGHDGAAYELMRAALADYPDLAGLYSVGGGNPGLARAWRESGHMPKVFIGHDLNPENALLLADGTLNVVLHHNLQDDMHAACRALMHFHGALPGAWTPAPTPIDVLTPYNMP